MRSILLTSGLRSATALFLFAVSLVSFAQSPGAGPGKVVSANGAQSLEYATTVTFKGKATPDAVKFYCSPKSDKTSRGALGLDISVTSAKTLAPFNFDDFEGPDAAANGKKLVKATIVRAGKPQVFTFSQSGSYATAETFAFGVANDSRLARSPARSLLEALGEPADSLHIVITNPRKAKQQLELSVPLSGRQAQFKALLVGLR